MSTTSHLRALLRITASLLVSITISITSASAQPELRSRDVITGIDTPWEITWGPDDWIWMTERMGRVSRVNPETGEQRTLLVIGDVHEDVERGLLGMVLDPQFDDSSFVYLAYTYQRGAETFLRLVCYRYESSADTLIAPVTLLDSIPGNAIHDGSRLAVSPDRTLFMTVGDAGLHQRAQDHTKINGKVLRINLDGTVPADNPWPLNPWPLNLLWTTGHRNPQGLVFTVDGRLYGSEHGPSSDDEVNLIERGRNYGWWNVHGYCDDMPIAGEIEYCQDSNVVEPLRAWTPTIAPAGLDYYNFSRPAIPDFRGSLLLVTLGQNNPGRWSNSLVQLKLDQDGRRIIDSAVYFRGMFGRLRDLCISPDGRVFIATSNQEGPGKPVPSEDDRIIEITQVPAGIADDPTAEYIRAMPHPVGTTALISFERPLGEGDIELFDLLGRRVRSEPFHGGDSYRFERRDLPPGRYMLVVSDARGSVRSALVLE